MVLRLPKVLTVLGRMPYWAIYFALAAILFVLSLMLPDPDVMPATAELKDSATAMLDAVKSITTLISALTTTLCAGAATVAVKGKEWSVAWNRFDGALIICVLLCGAVSYYGLYLSSIAILEMVEAGVFGINSPRLSNAITIQYYAVIIGYLVLGFVFCRLMEGRHPEALPR